MNQLAKWMMRLYPAAWRARYGDEMDALLADSGADAKTIANLLTGGIRMRFSTGSFMKLAVALGVAGMLLGLGTSYLRRPLYMSRATLEMTPVTPDGTPKLNEMIQRESVRVLSRTSLSGIINDQRLNLYSDERMKIPLEDVIDEMRRGIRIEYVLLAAPRSRARRAVAFNIRFEYPDKLKAQQTVNSLINAFMEQNQESQLDNGNRLFGEVLEVIDTASLPVQPNFPNRPKFASYGCLLGCLLAYGITVVRRVGHSPSAPMLVTNE